MAAVRKHYPRPDDVPSITIVPFEKGDRNALITELGSSKYTFPTTRPIIEMTGEVIVVSYPGTVTINCLSLDYVPLHKLKRVARRLKCILDIFQQGSPITIWFIPDPAARLMPENSGAPILAHHINGAYTYFHQHTIFVYRLEEFPKVMLHEMLHNTSINTASWPPSEGRRLSVALLGERTVVQVDPNEAIVETWAQMFQCLFISYENKMPFQELLDVEQRWGENQAFKLYAHFKRTKWSEKTNSFSYIVLRTILLKNLDGFLKLARPYVASDVTNFVIGCLPFKYGKYTNEQQRSLRMSWFGDL